MCIIISVVNFYEDISHICSYSIVTIFTRRYLMRVDFWRLINIRKYKNKILTTDCARSISGGNEDGDSEEFFI